MRKFVATSPPPRQVNPAGAGSQSHFGERQGAGETGLTLLRAHQPLIDLSHFLCHKFGAEIGGAGSVGHSHFRKFLRGGEEMEQSLAVGVRIVCLFYHDTAAAENDACGGRHIGRSGI